MKRVNAALAVAAGLALAAEPKSLYDPARLAAIEATVSP